MSPPLHYERLRAHMRTGDLLATDTPGPVGWAIKRVTRSGVSHVAGVVLIGTRRMVLEATAKGGVHLVALSRWLEQRKDGSIWYWPGKMRAGERALYRDALLSKVGARYESPKWMLLRVALKRRVRPNDRWFCSETEASARVAAQPERFGLLWPDASRVWPCDVVAAYGGTERAVLVLP